MKIYTLTFSDRTNNNNTVIIGTFSSYAKAWEALEADKGECMGDIALNYHEGVYSNPELGIGTLDYTPVGELSGNVTYSYNVNVTELDEAYNADDQVEL